MHYKLVDGVKHMEIKISPNQPTIHFVQDEIMKSVMYSNKEEDIYVNMFSSSKSPHYNKETDFNIPTYNYVEFDFHKYIEDKYLYSVAFPVDWQANIRMLGPVNFLTFEIINHFGLEWDTLINENQNNTTHQDINTNINAHFYLKGDDPHIGTFLKDYATQYEYLLRPYDEEFTTFNNGYFFFICTEIIEPVSYWYIIYTKRLPKIYIKDCK